LLWNFIIQNVMTVIRFSVILYSFCTLLLNRDTITHASTVTPLTDVSVDAPSAFTALKT